MIDEKNDDFVQGYFLLNNVCYKNCDKDYSFGFCWAICKGGESKGAFCVGGDNPGVKKRYLTETYGNYYLLEFYLRGNIPNCDNNLKPFYSLI